MSLAFRELLIEVYNCGGIGMIGTVYHLKCIQLQLQFFYYLTS